MMRLTSRAAAPLPLTLVAAVVAIGINAVVVSAQTYVVTNGDTVTLTLVDSPFSTPDGASIGGDPDPNASDTSSGTLIVGENVQWTNDDFFYVGPHYNATGTVEFMPGSMFTTTSTSAFGDPAGGVRIGWSGGQASVTVHAGATWNHTGYPGQTTFYLESGGELQLQGQLFSQDGMFNGGLVNVEGSDAWLSSSGLITIGNYHDTPAQMFVTGGGLISSSFIAVVGTTASYYGSDGQLIVGDSADAETSLFRGGTLQVGQSISTSGEVNHGLVTVNDNGAVEVKYLLVSQSGGIGDVEVHSGGTMLVANRINYINNGYRTLADLGADGTIDLSAGGKMVLDGVTNFGDTSVFDSVAPGTLRVGTGGELKGTGTIIGDVAVGAGGFVTPGHSTGTLNIVGDLTLDSGAALDIEINGADDFDQLLASGLLTLGGSLNLIFTGDFLPDQGQSFNLDLFGSTQLAGEFTGVTTEGLAEGLSAELDGASTGQPLSFTIVPEPASLSLLGMAGLLMLRRRTGEHHTRNLK